MTTALAMAQPSWTPAQKDLIKKTVALGATDDELAMFLHIAMESGLDPLRKQIHFMKYNGRVTIVADVNGLQARAAESDDFEGILCAAVYDGEVFEVDNATGTVTKHTSNPLKSTGKPLGAWATVKRRGMLPFTSIIRFTEYYSKNNPLWDSKPGVMAIKVAKSTALRLAFPGKFSGVYGREEMDQAERDVTPKPAGEATAALKTKVLASVAPTPPAPNKMTIQDVPKEETAATAALKATMAAAGFETTVVPITPYDRIKTLGEDAGLTGDELSALVKKTIGKKTKAQLTDDDVKKIASALVPVTTDGEPPDDVVLPVPEESVPF